MTAPSLRVLVLTAFGPETAADGSGELGRWLDGYGEFAHEIDVRGANVPLRITDHGVGVTATGIGPTPAATTLTAILASDAVDTDDAYVLVAGVAGISPEAGTVGGLVVADHVVDWDAKKRSAAGTAVEPWGFGPAKAYELDPDLVAAATDLVSGVDLEDSAAAREHRARYDGAPATDPPGVEVGTTVAGADFWHGHALAEQVDFLVSHYGAGTYATTECEGYAAAVVGERFGKLNRLVSVRAASNFDRPPCEEAAEVDWRMKGPAFRNAYRAGRAVADAIAGDWERWRDGPPATVDAEKRR